MINPRRPYCDEPGISRPAGIVKKKTVQPDPLKGHGRQGCTNPTMDKATVDRLRLHHPFWPEEA